MNLKDLRDIVKILSAYESTRVSPLPFSQLRNGNSKVAEFYKILLNEQVEDPEAAEMLYDGHEDISRYKSLKSYFGSRAINNIIFFDLSKSGKSARTVAIFKSYKYLFIVHVLIALGG